MLRRASHDRPLAELEAELARSFSGELRFDRYTRHLFATDASMYAIEPLGVAFPLDADDVVAAVETATRFGIPVLPRGAGTSLCGQTVGEALVLDFSRHMHSILEIDPDARLARVQPGVVQDDLNRAAAAHHLLFAPDTSTSNRATIGGMIGNNSCGSRSARFGMTIDHVESVDVVLSDASRARLRARSSDEVAALRKLSSLEGRLYREVPRLIESKAEAIRRDVPPHWRRSGGYRLERMLPEAGPFSLANLVVGSEGTLAVTVEAEVRLVPAPGAVAALVGHFESVTGAIDASAAAMECGATAVELIDRMIVDLARGSPIHRHLAEQLQGDPGAILWVEFYGATPGEAAAGMETLHDRWARDGSAYATIAAPTAGQQKGFRELRKAGQGLLVSAGRGRERSLAFVEDTAVPPERLAEYVARFARLLEENDLRAGFYGHASAGCLHIRPFIDLTRPGEIEKMRRVAEAVCVMVREYGGMNSSEHGDGIARAEFNRQIFGDEVYDAMREVKGIFDPSNRLNPGKVVDSPRMTDHLREPSLPKAPPLETYFEFDFEDGMRGAANRCMRIGACRKSAGAGGTMCPSYMATREEEHSTRGRANALVHALSSPDPAAALSDSRLHEILDLCLECKACKTECPMSIDLAAMKSEALSKYFERHGTPLRAKVFGHVRILNRLGSALAPFSNLGANAPFARRALERWVGIDRRRPLPRFRRRTLSAWYDRRSRSGRSQGRGPGTRGILAFLADSFTTYTEPEIGIAAIELLEAAGWEVRLVSNVCCGRSLISKGLLAEARQRHAKLIETLLPFARQNIPIVGCEPSCISTLGDELPALAGRSSESLEISRQARLADELVAEAIADGSLSIDPDSEVADRQILFHGHCHQKAARATAASVKLLQSIPGATVDVLDAGCCGMAGSFGFEAEHYELSMRIGGMRLFPAVRSSQADALIAATGVSCRQQIAHGTGRTARHPLHLLRSAVTLP
ncbi:MAG: FAD-binding protein [Gemmatimonas sp.]|nr:FAD-binding protein [Gemmatimonas sp.]